MKANLHLDSRAGLLAGGESGPSIVPGQPDKSLLIKAIRYHDEDLEMPPKERLPDAVVADFVAWVKRGAPDPRTDTKAPIGPDYAHLTAPTYANMRKTSIYGGSNEIQRNIIAKMVLGL